MRIPEIGELLRYRQTGNIFEVRKITSRFVILHSTDGLLQVMTGKESVFDTFEKISPTETLISPLEEWPLKGPPIPPKGFEKKKRM